MILKIIIFSANFFAMGHVCASFTESGVSFESYLRLAKEKAGEAVSIGHPSGQTGYMTSCSGVLLNPWTVLTAGHCVTDENLKLLPNPDQYTLGYGANRDSPNFTLQGRLAIVHPGYAKLGNGGRVNDVAIILLSRPFYDAYQYAQFAAKLPAVGEQVNAYGYGLKGGDQGIISSSNPGLNPNDPLLVAYQSVLENSQIPGASGMFGMIFDRKLDLGGNAAQGDSGGGVEDTSGKLIGIISSIDTPEPGKPSMRTQASNVTTPQMQDFISANLVVNTQKQWTGSGKVSDKSKWDGGDVPKNGVMHYYVPAAEGSKMIVDQDFKIDGVELQAGSSLEVIPGVKARFEAGLTLIKADAKVNGGMDSSSLVVKGGGKYTASEQINLFDQGYVFLDDGTVEAKSFSMRGGHLSGNGTISTSLFSHINGVISPSKADTSGGIVVQGDYKQTGDNASVHLRLFKDKTSDYLEVNQNKSSSLHFLLEFPDKTLSAGSKYAVFKSLGGIQTPSDFSISSLYKVSGDQSWEGGVLYLTITNFSLGVTVAEDTRQVYKSFQNLRASGGFIPSSVFEKIRNMSDRVFFKSLSAFSNPYIEKDLYKTINSTFLYEKHQGFRTTMFLEKERNNLDLRHFSFYGANSFSGRDVLIDKKEHSPLSFYISGNVYEVGAKYVTDGLRMGWDFAHGNELTGMGFYFRNQGYEKQSNFKDYQFDVSKVYRGNFTFLDYNFGTGFHAHDSVSQNEWGNWASSAQTKQTSLQSRIGFHNITEKYANLGYVGLLGSYTAIENMKSVSQDLEVQTKDYSGMSLKGKIGLENKVRFHVENMVFEPWFQICATIPLYENMKKPFHTFFGIEETQFQSSSTTTDFENMAISGGVRVGIARTMITSFEFSSAKQQNDVVNKMTLNINFKL